MSVNVHVYVGPYLSIPQCNRVVDKAIKSTCSNDPRHGVALSQLFCAVCGHPVTTTKSQVREYSIANPSSIPGMDEDVFYAPEYVSSGVTVWIPNKSYHPNIDQGGVVELAIDDRATALSDTSSKYASELALISAYVGLPIEFKYGVVTYWS